MPGDSNYAVNTVAATTMAVTCSWSAVSSALVRPPSLFAMRPH